MDDLDAIAQLQIQRGWDVIDADDQPIGSVADVHTESFSVETSVGGQREIAFRDVESADDGVVQLAISGDDLPSDGES